MKPYDTSTALTTVNETQTGYLTPREARNRTKIADEFNKLACDRRRNAGAEARAAEAQVQRDHRMAQAQVDHEANMAVANARLMVATDQYEETKDWFERRQAARRARRGE
jgi:hypothetical protein